jgi:hypothetical protein
MGKCVTGDPERRPESRVRGSKSEVTSQGTCRLVGDSMRLMLRPESADDRFGEVCHGAPPDGRSAQDWNSLAQPDDAGHPDIFCWLPPAPAGGAAGIQAYGLLAFTYSGESDQLTIDYVGVGKPDGTRAAEAVF